MKKLLTACVTAYLSLILTGCATWYASTHVKGDVSSLSSTHYRALNPEQVTLYEQFNVSPADYILIGKVRVDNRYGYGLGALTGRTHSREMIDEKLKSEAASIGANAVIEIRRYELETLGTAVISRDDTSNQKKEIDT